MFQVFNIRFLMQFHVKWNELVFCFGKTCQKRQMDSESNDHYDYESSARKCVCQLSVH